MAAAAPKLKGATRDASRAGSLRKAQRQSARNPASEVQSGGEGTPQAPQNPSYEGELRKQRTATTRAQQDEQLKQVAKRSRGGVATLDKRTGKIKEGIGGADSKEIAQQMKRVRSGKGSGAKEAALQAKDLRSGEKTRREFQGATRGAREEKLKKNFAEAAGTNKSRLKRMKAGLGTLKGMDEEMKKFAGVWWIRTNWAWIFPSFGHSIYLINFSYFIGFMQKQIGFYLPITIPEVGGAWAFDPAKMVGNVTGPTTGAGGKKQGKSKTLILKLFEFLAIAFITLFVVAVDMLFLASIGIIIMMAAKASNTPIVGGAIDLVF